MYPLYSGRPSTIFRPTYPRPPTALSPATILDALKALKPNSAVVMPSLLEAWVHDVAAVEYIKNLDEIVSVPEIASKGELKKHLDVWGWPVIYCCGGHVCSAGL
jgi:hypothetical protein